MALLKTRIVPRTDARAFAWMGAACAAVWALVLAGVAAMLFALLGHMLRHAWWLPVQNAIILVFVLAPITVMLRLTQRWRAVFAFAAAYGLVLIAMGFLYEVFSRIDGGAIVSEWVDAELLVVPVAFALLLMAAAGLRAVVRWIVRRVDEHGPEDCPRCGYTYGSERIEVCAECGLTREAGNAIQSRIDRRYAHARRASVWTLGTAGVVAAAWVGYSIWTRTIPTLQFLRSVPHDEAFTATANEIMMIDPAYPGDDGVAVWVRERPGALRGVTVWYSPSADTQVPMAVWVSELRPTGLGSTSGDSLSTAGLSRAQAERVLKYGMPADLVRTLYKKADEVNWSAGVNTRSGPLMYRISASEFFKN